MTRMAKRPTKVTNGMCEHGACDWCPHGCFDHGEDMQPMKDLELILKNMNLEKKIRAFNLLPINENMISFLEEYYPELRNIRRWDFVKFHGARPYFYSRAYIEAHTIDELLQAFSIVVIHD